MFTLHFKSVEDSSILAVTGELLNQWQLSTQITVNQSLKERRKAAPLHG